MMLTSMKGFGSEQKKKSKYTFKKKSIARLLLSRLNKSAVTKGFLLPESKAIDLGGATG